MHSYNYKILEDLNLFIELYSGKLKPENYFHLKQEHLSVKKNYNIIVDITTLIFDETLQTFSNFAHSHKNTPLIITSGKTALITKTPKQVVIATLIKEIFPQHSYKIEIFSTYFAATEWIGIDKEDFNTVYSEITKLKSNGIIQ